jgi:hypothetical protein
MCLHYNFADDDDLIECFRTCHYEGPGFYDYLSVLGNGDYLNDTLVLGGVTLENMYFGYTSSYVRPDRVTGNVATILGLSLDCQGGGPECTGKGPVLLPQLKNASIIDSMSTSIYLGRDDWDVKNARILIGGAYDKAKVDGDMFTIDMVNPHDLQLANGQTNSVNVTSTEVVIDNGNGTAINRTAETYGNKDVGVPVLLDTGIAAWYMTETIFAAVYHGLGGRGDVPAGTRYVPVDCIYRDPSYTKSYVSVGFGTAGTVKVPLHALVSQYEDGSCGSFIMARGDTVSTMGDPFLRGVYSIFDQENWTISLGQVRHTDEEDIVPIPKGGFKAER